MYDLFTKRQVVKVTVVEQIELIISNAEVSCFLLPYECIKDSFLCDGQIAVNSIMLQNQDEINGI